MASDVEMANRALQKLGATRITSLTDNSTNARSCNFAFQPVKLAELRKHPWNFAIDRASLAADAVPPAWGKANSFQLPSDFLRLAPDYPEYNFNDKDWQIEGRKILTDDGAPLYIRYIKNVTDPNQMDPLFREAFATKLAIEICEELTQSNTKKAELKQDYELIIREAKKTNAIENISAEPAEDTWISERA